MVYDAARARDKSVKLGPRLRYCYCFFFNRLVYDFRLSFVEPFRVANRAKMFDIVPLCSGIFGASKNIFEIYFEL